MSTPPTSLDESEIIRILKSEAGFSAELRALDVFMKNKIQVEANIYYVDHDHKKPREIDIVARISKENVKSIYGEIEFQFICVCDVKSSDATTIILSSPPAGPEKMADLRGVVAVDYKDSSGKWSLQSWNLFRVLTPENVSPRIGRTAIRVNTNATAKDKNRVSDQATQEAMFATIKASRYFVERQQDDVQIDSIFNDVDMKIWSWVGFPMVIVDGPLFEYFYENGEEKIEKARIVPVKFTTASVDDAGSGEVPSEKVKATRLQISNDYVLFCHIDAIEEFIGRARRWIEKHAGAAVDRRLATAKEIAAKLKAATPK